MWANIGRLAGQITVILMVLGIVFGPWIIVWAWNTLFGGALLIAYTWQTWLAVLILGVFVRGSIVARKSK